MSVGGGGSGKGLSLDTTLAVLDQAWQDREVEAAALTAAHPAMALALRMYALEIRIKVAICKHLALENLPQHCRTHELLELIIFTGPWPELEDPANAAIRSNWDLLVRFGKQQLNNLRYKPSTGPSEGLGAFDPVVLASAFDDTTAGVHTWLSRHP